MVKNFLVLFVCAAAAAAGDADPVAASVARMQIGIEKQRASVRRQVIGASADAFFTTPWSDSPPGVAVPPVATGDCDPLPPDQLRRLILEASVREGINPLLVSAVVRRESGGRPCAVSPKGAQGLMQLMPGTQAELGVRDPFDPAENLNAGTRYLKQLLTRFKSDLRLTLAAYNAGPQRVEAGGAVPAIPETQAYVQAILSEVQGASDEENR